MKLVSIPVLLTSILLGLVLCAVIQSNSACTSMGGAPTTQQADELVAHAAADAAQVNQALATAKSQAATQPSNAELAAQIKILTTASTAAQKAVNIADAVDRAAYHNDASGVLSIAGAAIPQPWGTLAVLAGSIGYGWYQSSQKTAAVKAQVVTEDALKQFAQTTHAITSDATMSQINSAVDSTTRAAVNAAGVVHIPDPPTVAAVAEIQAVPVVAPPAAAIAPASLMGVYPASFPTNKTGG